MQDIEKILPFGDFILILPQLPVDIGDFSGAACEEIWVATRLFKVPERFAVLTFIPQEPEFTPKNVQTQEERTKLVFAVKIELKNEDMALKPGMPADAEILLSGSR